MNQNIFDTRSEVLIVNTIDEHHHVHITDLS